MVRHGDRWPGRGEIGRMDSGADDAAARTDGAPGTTLAGLAPPLAEVPLPAPNAAALLRRNGTDSEYADRPALHFGDRQWTHRELLAESERFAALFRARLDPGRPPHVGLLLDNTPDYVFALCGAGLAGAAVAGLNYTRRGEHLGHDISHTDVQFVITEPRHEEQLRAGTAGVALPGGILVSDRFSETDEPPAAGEPLERALQAAWADQRQGRSGQNLLWRTPTRTRCGRCSSHRERRLRPRRCAARNVDF